MDQAIKYHTQLAKIKKEQWKSAEEFATSIVMKDWASLVDIIKNLKISSLITAPFEALFKVFDTALVAAFSDEIEKLFKEVLTEENIQSAIDAAKEIKSLYDAIDDLSESVSGSSIVENIGKMASAIEFAGAKIRNATDAVKKFTAWIERLQATIETLMEAIGSGGLPQIPGGILLPPGGLTPITRKIDFLK